MAAVVPVWQLEEWQKRRKRLFEAIEEVWRKNKRVKPGLIEREVDEAVRAARARGARRKT